MVVCAVYQQRRVNRLFPQQELLFHGHPSWETCCLGFDVSVSRTVPLAVR